MPEKIIGGADKPDRIDDQGKIGQIFIANRIGIKNVAKPDANDIKKLAEQMAKTKKHVEYVLSFDGSAVIYFVRCASLKIPIESINIANDTSLDLDKVLDNLVLNGVATKDQAVAFHKAHPDVKALEALKTQMTALDTNIKQEQAKLAALKKQYTDMGGK